MGFAADLAEWLDVVPPPLAVFVLAMSPVGEVRVSIPVAILAYGMGWAEAFTWSLLGNFAVVPLLAWLYPAMERGLRRWSRMDGWIDRLYARTRHKVGERVRRFEEYAVFGFIATPVPGTGAWSGALVAHIFGLPFRAAAPYYYAGIVTACFITAMAVEAGVWGFNQL